jgi:shikimate dehydrogenase
VGEARSITGETRVTGVMGWPVAHSLSPTIHNAAYRALGLDWVYVAMPVPPGAVGGAVHGLAAMGFAGANVTMPHKEAAAEAVDRLTEDAERLRAVNSIHILPDGITGANTDAPGFGRFLERDAGFDPAGATALVFGAGGAARACALALARAGAAEIVVALRDPARAAAVADSLEGLQVRVRPVAFEQASEVRPDLIVNATPLGAHGEELPLPPVGVATVAVDLLYRPATTPLQAAVREVGGTAFAGLGLLLHQAALSFELWTGQPAPMEVMSAAALSALGHDT